MKSPKVFISYSWDNQNHKEWVIALANELRRNGIDATFEDAPSNVAILGRYIINPAIFHILEHIKPDKGFF